MRWEVLARDGEPLEPLPDPGTSGPGVQNPNECTRVGIVSVEVTAFDDFGIFVDQRKYPCYPREFFSPRGTARGAVVSDGSYEIVVRGVRRNGLGWTGVGADLGEFADGTPIIDRTPRCDKDTETCETGFFSCDCRFIDTEEGHTVLLDDLVLEPPPECEDGIDNDTDGLVDGVDPGCSIGGVSEFDDISSVQFQVETSVLGRNPNATCGGVGLSEFAFFVHNLSDPAGPSDCSDGADNDGDDLIDEADPGCALGSSESDELGTTPCRLAPFFFTTDLSAGSYELRFVGLGPDGQPATHVVREPFEVVGRGGFVTTSIDFADADFLEPIQRNTLIPLEFESSPGSTPHRCTSYNGDLVIDALRVNVLDARGQELDTPILAQDGTPLDGRRIDCPSSNLRTQTLTWGGYLVDLQALALVPNPDDPMAPPTEVVCYSTAATNGPEPLAPGEPSFTLVRPAGMVPDACTECDANDPSRKCHAGTCVEGVCVE
jgi:hypothetical protein